MARHGKHTGMRQMIGLLKLAKEFGRERLRQTIETALETGCTDVAAVEHLIHTPGLHRAVCEAVDISSLERYQGPWPIMREYDQLLAMGGVE